MHILRYLVLFTVVFGLAYVVYQYMGEENVQPTMANASLAQKPEVFVQMGHLNQVNAVAFSPDGKFALSGSHDKTLRLWEVATGREIRTFKGHSSYVESVAFSHYGHTVLSGSWDETIKLWNVATGHEIRTFQNGAYVNAVAFSPDGRTALSGDYYGKTKLWEIATGREIRTFQGHSHNVNAVAFSPDGKLALSGGDDMNGTLKLWEVATGLEIHTFQQGHVVGAVAFSPDGRTALSSSDTIKLWDVATGQEIRTFQWHSGFVDTVSFSPDGRTALSSRYKTIKLWNVATGREIRTFQGLSGSSDAVTFSPDGKLALSGSDNTLKLWNVETGREIRSFQGYPNPVEAVSFSPDGRTVLLASDNIPKLLDLESGTQIRTFQGHSNRVKGVAFSPDGHTVVSGSFSSGEYDTTIQFLKVANAHESKSLKTFSPLFDGSQKIGTLEVLAVVQGFTACAEGIPYNGIDTSIKLWNVESGSEIDSFDVLLAPAFSAVALSPDGDAILNEVVLDACSDTCTFELLNVAKGYKTETFGKHGCVMGLALSPDERTALLTFGNEIELWNIEKWQKIRSFQGHLDEVKFVFFSPDGSTAMSGSIDGTARLWNIETGKEIAQFVSFKDGEWITITPEGYYTASLNGAKYLNVRVGNQVYGIEQYEAIYHRPDIVQLALKLGDSQQAVAQLTRNAPPVQIAQVQPPKIWFVAPQQGHETDRSTITVNIETEEIVDSAESVTFKVNGRPIGREKGKRDRAKVAGVKTQSYHRQVPLQIGENQIEAEVRGKAGAVQRTSILVIRKGKVVKLPDLYFLGIGVAAHPTLSLQYPAKDVTKLAETFKKQRGRAYNKVFIKTLTNQQATRINLIQAITTFFKDAKQGDIAIVYVSGHGMNTSMGYHFLTYDANPDSLEATGASWQTFDAIYDLPAHVFLWVDTCRAGNIVGNTDWKDRAQEARPDIFLRDANNRGVIVFASSSGSDVSQEDKRWEHSAFAKALLDGLNGEAADKKGRIPFDMLRRHVLESVEEMTDGLQKPTIPRITGTGAFLDLVLAKK